MDVAEWVFRETSMTSKNKLDLPEWYERLWVASEELRLAVEEISALCSLRGVDTDADWCQHLVCAVVHGHESFREVEAVFDVEDPEAEDGPIAPSALYVKSH
jgi:hypothetical protein